MGQKVICSGELCGWNHPLYEMLTPYRGRQGPSLNTVNTWAAENTLESRIWMVHIPRSRKFDMDKFIPLYSKNSTPNLQSQLSSHAPLPN